jgi:hypothetical protein
MKTLKRLRILAAAGMIATAPACQSFLDVNTNPNAPQDVSANLYLAPMLHWFVTSPQFDGRFIGHIAQEWYSTTTAASPPLTWGRMGYDPSSDNGAQQWRDVYWSIGQNLVDMMTKAEAEQRWDLLGVGYILKAWGWQVLTDMHGEIIIKQAIDQSRFSFDYDTQEFAYQEVQRLLGLAITNLQRTDGAVDAAYMARTDKIYNGDRTKWLKLAYGLLAMNLNHYTNKSTYKPADVIANVDKSFVSNADDALMQYAGTNNDDRNFLGNTRNNVTLYRQTRFIVGLMDGTVFGAVDPRMSRMLAAAPDGVYRGLDINVSGFGALAAAQQPMNFFGYTALPPTGSQSRYIFSDRSRIPNMTYAQLQFIKAEAAYKMGDKAMALNAYRNAVSSHIDFVNARNTDDNQSASQISAAEKAAFLADTRIVPTNPNALTLTQIMSQKYIAQWGWGHNELWMDLRRYHYTDLDPGGAAQVFPGFAFPTTFYVNNNGKPAQRIRARFNSEYVWNIPALQAIGGLALDFHTKPIWITEP